MILNHHDALTFVVRNFNMTELIAYDPWGIGHDQFHVFIA